MPRLAHLPTMLFAMIGLATSLLAHAQLDETSFIVQGDLRAAGSPAQGSYDFEARLYLPGGTAPLITQSLDAIAVTDGTFALTLDFTDVPFQQFGSAVTIELAARLTGDSGPFVVFDRRLTPEAVPVAQVARSVMAGSVGAVAIRADEVQRRIGTSCPIGQAIGSVGSDGSVVCDVDDAGVAIVAGQGLSGGGSAGSVDIAVDFATVQRRVGGSCPEGRSIRAIAEDGTVTCEFDDVVGTVAVQSASVNFFGGSGSTVQTQTTALCPTSWRVVGGGFRTDCPAALIHTSSPTPSNVGWFVQLTKSTPTACPNPGTLTAFAVCVPN